MYLHPIIIWPQLIAARLYRAIGQLGSLEFIMQTLFDNLILQAQAGNAQPCEI